MTKMEEQCPVFISESGSTRRRYVDEFGWYSPTGEYRAVKGNHLPREIWIRLGSSRQAYSTLEVFDRRRPRLRVLPDKPAPWPTGRDAATGIVAIFVFQIAVAFTDFLSRTTL